MLSLSKTTTWVAATVALCLVLTAAGWLLLIAPKRVEAAETRDQTAATQAASRQLELEITELKAQFAELPQRQAELAAVKQAMPEDAQLPALIRDLDAKATASGVTLMTLTPGIAVALAGAGAEVAVPVDPATDTTTSTPAGGTPAADMAAPASETLVAIPVVVTVVGNFFNAETFLKSLQTELSRDYLVQGLSIVAEIEADASSGKPAVTNGDVTMTITGSVFVLRTQGGVAPDAAAETTPSQETTP